MFKLVKTDNFLSKADKLIQKNKQLSKRINKSLTFLRQNPKHPGLRTHQINDPDYGKIWSSWVHGDLRIFWKYEGEVIVILLLDIGSHDEIY
jgi:mRNA-degrading endonuclease YafQ of YafQ-DinJ toxin-antitoxin module